MKKLSLTLTIYIFFIFIICPFVYADNTVEAKVTKSSMRLNNNPVWCDGFNIFGNNYYKLRDLAEIFSETSGKFDVIWNSEKNMIEIITGKAYSNEVPNWTYYNPFDTYTAKPTTSKILVDGVSHSITAYNIDGYNYFRLWDLAELIPFELKWDASKNTIMIYSQIPENAYKTETAYNVEDNAVSSSFPRWSSTVTTYLIKNDDNTINVVEAKGEITVETYDEQYNLIGKKSFGYELPLFGGFYSGKKHNYIAFGQSNHEENDSKEVIRIVRYDKNFNRIDSISIKGGESFTVEPFAGGSGKMAEDKDILVFHTSRLRYTEDGRNHQSQLTVIIDMSTMSVKNELGRFQSNHVSHSFDQYVLFDGNDHVFVDHGDGYPRSIVLHKQEGTRRYSEVDLFTIPGEVGANYTGVSVGGFETSSTNYIIAMNTIDHSLVSRYTSFGTFPLILDQRDILLCVLPKNRVTNSAVKQITLGKYIGSEKIASIPTLVKISEDNLAVLWQEFDIKRVRGRNLRGDLKYVLIDENGNSTTEIQTVKNFVLSKCQPLVIDNKIIWYTNENGMRIFYSIPFE